MSVMKREIFQLVPNESESMYPNETKFISSAITS